MIRWTVGKNYKNKKKYKRFFLDILRAKKRIYQEYFEKQLELMEDDKIHLKSIIWLIRTIK